jgi:hypothetical protein
MIITKKEKRGNKNGNDFRYCNWNDNLAVCNVRVAVV